MFVLLRTTMHDLPRLGKLLHAILLRVVDHYLLLLLLWLSLLLRLLLILLGKLGRIIVVVEAGLSLRHD